MDTYSASQVVPSIRKIGLIKDVFQNEYDNFIGDFSDKAFDEYSRFMRALGKGPQNADEADFFEFEKAFYNQTDAWNFIREIILLFGLLNSLECEICLKRAICYNNMTDTSPDDCPEADAARDFKVGLILFIYLKYFTTIKASLIYD